VHVRFHPYFDRLVNDEDEKYDEADFDGLFQVAVFLFWCSGEDGFFSGSKVKRLRRFLKKQWLHRRYSHCQKNDFFFCSGFSSPGFFVEILSVSVS
jgi:hypothetical protein